MPRCHTIDSPMIVSISCTDPQSNVCVDFASCTENVPKHNIEAELINEEYGYQRANRFCEFAAPELAQTNSEQPKSLSVLLGQLHFTYDPRTFFAVGLVDVKMGCSIGDWAQGRRGHGGTQCLSGTQSQHPYRAELNHNTTSFPSVFQGRRGHGGTQCLSGTQSQHPYRAKLNHNTASFPSVFQGRRGHTERFSH
eukprot:gene12524-biopygen3412